MKWVRPAAVLATAALVAGLSACGSDSNDAAAGTTTTAAAGGSFDVAAARAYCTDKKGVVQVRHPVWGTNNDPSTWVDLAGQAEMCMFQTLNDEAKSKIVVDLMSLYSDGPTLASVAYLAKIPPPPFTGANPATLDCQALDGSSQFGNTLAGGGWIAPGATTSDDVVNLCVFPDGSFIDDWGITYYAGGVVRGIDLKTVFRYQPTTLPAMFQATKK
jgi:putative hemolysin